MWLARLHTAATEWHTLGRRYPSSYAQRDRQIVRRLQRLGYRPTVIADIGASTGIWSHRIAHDVPGAAYHLFEPLAETVPAYRRALTGRLQSHPRFTLHCLALGNQTGTIVVRVPLRSPVSATTLPWVYGPAQVYEVPISVVRVDDLVQAGTLPAPHLMKLDVQGGEFAILEGARQTLPLIDVLLIECWLWRGYGPETPLWLEVARWLDDVGFSLFDLGDPYRDPETDTLTTIDCAFVNRHTMAPYLGFRMASPHHSPPFGTL
jgi:FkbM family methyltransferase